MTAAQQAMTQNYNQNSTGFNFSVSYPLKRHAFQRVGFTYALSKSTISAFSTASRPPVGYSKVAARTPCLT